MEKTAASKIPDELVSKITLMAYHLKPHPLATMMDEFWWRQGINVSCQWGGHDVPEDYLGLMGWFLFKPDPVRSKVNKWIAKMNGEDEYLGFIQDGSRQGRWERMRVLELPEYLEETG